MEHILHEEHPRYAVTPSCYEPARTRMTVLLHQRSDRDTGSCEGITPQWFIREADSEFSMFTFDIDGKGTRLDWRPVPVSFCPYCGTKLPTPVKTTPLLHPIRKVTDGGYYCDTCGDRLACCRCWPELVGWRLERNQVP